MIQSEWYRNRSCPVKNLVGLVLNKNLPIMKLETMRIKLSYSLCSIDFLNTEDSIKTSRSRVTTNRWSWINSCKLFRAIAEGFRIRNRPIEVTSKISETWNLEELILEMLWGREPVLKSTLDHNNNYNHNFQLWDHMYIGMNIIYIHC